MTGSSPETGPEPATSADDELDRRRLIRWIAVLAFSVPVVVELFTFSGLIENHPLSAGDDAATSTDPPTAEDDAVGVGDELLPETAATETVTASEVRQDGSGDRTYVLRVDVENGTEATVALRTRALRLRDDRRRPVEYGCGAVGGIASGDCRVGAPERVDAECGGVRCCLGRGDGVRGVRGRGGAGDCGVALCDGRGEI